MKIIHRNGRMLVDNVHATIKTTLVTAIAQDADLRGADLRGATLEGVTLRDATLGGADLGGADLGGANLRGADLRGADLRGAYLRGANLRDADLRDADLRGADLEGADLRGADLGGANLQDATLMGANLVSAILAGANLQGCFLETGECFEDFCRDVVPALIQAGGHPVPQQAWACHDWGNCPMAVAFGVRSIENIPRLYRPRVDQFIRLFDAGFIPTPTPNEPKA